jgi:hypothetical protein
MQLTYALLEIKVGLSIAPITIRFHPIWMALSFFHISPLDMNKGKDK